MIYSPIFCGRAAAVNKVGPEHIGVLLYSIYTVYIQ